MVVRTMQRCNVIVSTARTMDRRSIKPQMSTKPKGSSACRSWMPGLEVRLWQGRMAYAVKSKHCLLSTPGKSAAAAVLQASLWRTPF